MPEEAIGLERVAKSVPDHELYGLPVPAIARPVDTDDVLNAIEDGTGRVADVHLTWRRNPPERACRLKRPENRATRQEFRGPSR